MVQNTEHQGGARESEVEGKDSPEHIARPVLPMRIDGPHEEVADEVEQLSPEGRPADATAGPGLLATEVLIAPVLFGLIAIAMGIWLGWAIGVAIFAIALVAIMFNPAIIAALLRMKERDTVARRHNDPDRDEPPVKVVRPQGFDAQ